MNKISSTSSHIQPFLLRRSLRLVALVAGSLLILLLLGIQTYRTIPEINVSIPEIVPDPFPKPIVSQKNLQDVSKKISPPPSTHGIKKSIAFRPPIPSVQQSVVRGDGVVWTGDNETIWHSVGRHPNRQECWTYDDRYGVYKKPSHEMFSMMSNVNKGNNKRAIILRLTETQPWKLPFIQHVRALAMEAGYLGKWDVIILIHHHNPDPAKVRQKVPKELRSLVRTFTTKHIKDWMPSKAKFKNIMEHNHLAIQMFMATSPKYDFVYSIESDVRLIGRWNTFLADIDGEYSFHHKNRADDQKEMPNIPDLVSFESLRRPRNDWVWLQDGCKKHFKNDMRASLGAMWGWSRRLTNAMDKHNSEGFNCYYEYFAPTIAYQEDLTMFFYQHPLYCPNRESPSGRNSLNSTELGKNDPRRVQFNKVAAGCTVSKNRIPLITSIATFSPIN
ncbi:hypothetical protein ABW20_dc0108364 [Dactylellina cionopaga]|nr:hypothetical protein ABW20_dc0108364 [Dactylellina cionopaga]